MIDLSIARTETPGCQNVIHFNNAGAALMPRPVVEAIVSHIHREAAIGGYEAAREAHALIDHTYQAAAALINAQPDEIAIVENATVAWQMAFYSLPFTAGDRILTARASYAGNYLSFLHLQKRVGVQIDIIPNDADGQIDVDALREMMDDRVRLIAVTHVPTNNGLVNPAAAVGAVARDRNCLYLLDACQSVGQLPVDVAEIGCDMLSTTGRKWLRGPRGVGFLYVRRDLAVELEPPFIDLHAATWEARDAYRLRPDARRFENWESNVAAVIGLGVAAAYTQRWGMAAIWERVQALGDRLRAGLAAIPGVQVHDIGLVQGGIVTFTADGLRPAQIQTALARRNINVNTTDITSTRLDMEDRKLIEVVRSSVHYYNTESEVDQMCTAVANLL